MNTPWLQNKPERSTDRDYLRCFCPYCHRVLRVVFLVDELSDRHIRKGLAYSCKTCKSKQDGMIVPIKSSSSTGASTSQQSHTAGIPSTRRRCNMSFPHQGSVPQRAGSLPILRSPSEREIQGRKNFSGSMVGGAK